MSKKEAPKQNSIVLEESTAILDAHTLFNVPPEELTVDEGLMAWSVLDVFEKTLIGNRKKALREVLMGTAEQYGETNKNGSFIYKLKELGAKIEKRKRAGKVKILVDKVLEVFKNKAHVLSSVMQYTVTIGQAQMDAFDVIHSWLVKATSQFDSDKVVVGNIPPDVVDAMLVFFTPWKCETSVSEDALEALVQVNQVTLEELAKVTEVGDPSWALFVKKPKIVTELLERSKKNG